jgi:signal transduction histidine kinase
VRRLRVAIVVGGIALGLAAEWVSYESGELAAAGGDLIAGWVLIGCGLVAWERRGDSRFGPLVAAAGVAWLLGSLWTAALYLHRGPLVHALLCYPSGRVSRRFSRAVVVAAYVDGAIEPLASNPVVTLVLSIAVVAAAIESYVSEVGTRRRARAGAAAGAVAVALVLGLGAVGRLAGSDVGPEILWAYEVVLAVLATALLGELLRGRWSQAAVTGLVVELGELREPVTLRERLARALGDNSLELGYRVGAGYVDEAGRPFGLPRLEADRAVTPIETDGELVAVLVHDRAVLDDTALLEAVAVATRLAVANARLQAEVRARVDQLAASRRRIVETADAQRRQLERELHEGTERRLDALSEQVAALEREVDELGARRLLADVEHQLGVARAELAELARGIHPTALTNGGLAAALPELASRTPVALDVDVDVDVGRAPTAVEAAAYFVCSEALTNVAKHGCATRARIDVKLAGDGIAVTITDDGIGGADARRGSGLRGLADRVEALGGRLSVESPPGAGTRIVAEIPTA